MITNEQIKNLCSRLRLYALPRLLESEAHLAQEQGKTHVEFLHDLLSREVQERDSKDFQRRLKAAALPAAIVLQGLLSSRWMLTSAPDLAVRRSD